MGDVRLDEDPGPELLALVPQVNTLRAQIETLLEVEDFLGADEKQKEITVLVERISSLPVCPGCWIEVPSTTCRKSGMETWRYVGGRTLCSYCGEKALRDGSGAHCKQILTSLRRRVRSELTLCQQMAGSHL